VVTEALSKGCAFVSTLETKVSDIEHIKDLYESDLYFYSKFLNCEHAVING